MLEEGLQRGLAWIRLPFMAIKHTNGFVIYSLFFVKKVKVLEESYRQPCILAPRPEEMLFYRTPKPYTPNPKPNPSFCFRGLGLEADCKAYGGG